NGTVSSAIQVVSPGTCSGCTWTSRQSAVPDPFAGLAIPSESGLPVFTDGDPAHGPGVYRTKALTFPNGATTLAAGTYIVESGFSFAAKANVSGEGVLLFNGCGAGAPGGCANNGTFSIAGQNTITLDTTTAGPNGMAIWQPVANRSALSIDGQGNL